MPAVLLGPASDTWRMLLDDAARSVSASHDLEAALAFAHNAGRSAPHLGGGQTRQLWELLATTASADLTVARVLDPHLDALGIRAQAGLDPDPSHTWGVYAAEGPGSKVTATSSPDGWHLTGAKPWCSLAGHLDRALITAHTGDSRRLFEIDLRHDGVTVTEGEWFARGLAEVTSSGIELTGVPAEPVGGDGWYLTRAGFAWGGMGVAAVWFGGAVALARSLKIALDKREPDQIGVMILGEVDVLLHSCRTVLAAAAASVDAGAEHPDVLAQRVRSTVSSAAERISTIVGHALGPAPLAMNEDHARRVADLQLYLRQDHAERDLARLGTKLLALEGTPW